ncbi:RICIN domain-containing protein [Streptomyces sp. DSM 41699]|uniref:RICIN domain-containing protein n=1 Tax=Streptomyces gibsoniae TaxID=3075529 RepID=A0ABU2TS41_9ACTN|nr:RICIN domain-containing protein [Streptomyces sp. DSM 41699]MDT0463636.1 RICIN domain-containing protein [Streptomyces sp. DSM 41699]
MTLGSPAAPASAAPAGLPDGYATVVNSGSGKCLDARAAATANGTVVQQYSCNNSTAQQWSFTATGDGYVRITNRNDSAQVVDVTDVSTADSAPVQLWAYGGGDNQQWQPVDEGGGAYHFVNRHSGKCLDVPAASAADSVQLAQYTCNGTAAQRFQVAPVSSTPGDVDLGPNVVVFDPSMSSSAIQSRLNSLFRQQETNQFGSQRYAVLFKPGTYSNDVNVGFYTQVLGLGLSPDAVTVNGAVHAEADWFQGNATQNFWRGAENLSVDPTGGTDRWAVSQAAPYRRMHLRGNLALDDGGWSSGGYLADSKIDGQVRSGTQQQWLTRNFQLGSWTGANWNMVFVGSQGVPSTSFPNPPYTTVDRSPVTREKPFGPSGASASHAGDPTSLHDVYFRVGGAGVGKATTSLVVNSRNVIGDHMWIWRADHGSGVGWTQNTADTGLIVNGDDVTMYGLFVEHFQKYQTIWNGNGGRTYFYQNEMPYDPPNQAAWMNGSTQGYAAYEVANSVTSHQAYGLGSYCYFSADPGVTAEHAFEVPNTPGVRFHDMVTVSLGGTGTIRHVINDRGGPSNTSTNVANLVSYP